MNFFKKVGRPTDEEQMMIQSIQRIIEQKNIPSEEVPECTSLEDLIEVKTLMESYFPSVEPAEDFPLPNIDQDEQPHYEQAEQSIPEPFEQEEPEELPEINDWEEDNEPVLTEPEVIKTKAPQFIADDYDPFADPVIERSYNNGQQVNQEQTDPEEEQLDLEDSKVNNLDDLNPATKRRAAEQTANALLKGYARLIPEPFKWMAKLPESKIEKMSFNGELDLSIEVSEGVSFDDYMKQSNEQIDEIFEVQEETLQEIKEPLIEVLMEQQLELTPAQRLTMAVISHLVQMFTVALKLRQQNNRILAYQKHLTALSRVRSAAA